MKRFISSIDQLQDYIFNYQLSTIRDSFIQFINELERVSHDIPNDRKVEYNQCLLYILQAFENKDYLLLADLVEYELKPLVGNFTGGAG